MSLATTLPPDPLIKKLSQFLRLTERDVAAVADLMGHVRRFPARADIASEGDEPRWAFVLIDGMACRLRTMSDGRRQILTVIVPGDICDIHAVMLKRMDHSIGTIAPTSIATIAREKLLATIARYPRINAALWWNALHEEAMQREHVVALGRRNAHERVAYLLCELVWRYSANGIGGPDAIPLPMNQTDIADVLGLTPIHVNRVLQNFRKERLIVLDRHQLRLLDMERLMLIAELGQNYLHLDGAPTQIERECARQERRQGAPPPRAAPRKGA